MKRELYITYFIDKQAAVRNVLNANNIKYKLKVVNRGTASIIGSSRSRTGTFGQNPNLDTEYIFYVGKDDLANAQMLLRDY